MEEKGKSTVFDCHIIQLSRIENATGNVTSVSSYQDIPFDIKRAYYLYDIPGGESRGGHAHKRLEQLIVAASGSFDVMLDDGKNKKNITLNLPHYGLFIRPGIWRELVNFSSGAVVIVIASTIYNEDDYIRDYQEFIRYKFNSSFIYLYALSSAFVHITGAGDFFVKTIL